MIIQEFGTMRSAILSINGMNTQFPLEFACNFPFVFP